MDMPELTPDILERACRYLCILRGLDPSKLIPVSRVRVTPQWKTLIPEIETRYKNLK